MFKKKKNLLVAICFLITFALFGCTGSKSESIKEEKPKPKVEDSLTRYLEALKVYDEKTITEYSANKPRDLDLDDDKKEEEIIKLVMEKVEYSIESVTLDGDKATAKVKTKAVDFERFIPKYVKQRVSTVFKNLSDLKEGKPQQKEETHMQTFKDMIASKDCTMKEKVVTVYLSLKDDKWVVENGEDVVKTMFNVRLLEEVKK